MTQKKAKDSEKKNKRLRKMAKDSEKGAMTWKKTKDSENAHRRLRKEGQQQKHGSALRAQKTFDIFLILVNSPDGLLRIPKSPYW